MTKSFYIDKVEINQNENNQKEKSFSKNSQNYVGTSVDSFFSGKDDNKNNSKSKFLLINRNYINI